VSRYDLPATKLGILLKDPEALAIITKHAPDLLDNPMLAMAKLMSFHTVIGLAAGQIDRSILDALTEDLSAL